MFVEFESGLRGVLTCQHLFPGSTTNKAHVVWYDGHRESGDYVVDKFHHDIAFVFVDRPGFWAARVAASPPASGEQIEYAGFGGPLSKLRHFYATTQGVGAQLHSTASPIFGDSGGPFFNLRGEVIAIQSTGGDPNSPHMVWVDPRNPQAQYPVFRSANAPTVGPIRKFLERIRAQRCPPQGPQGQQPGGGGAIAGGGQPPADFFYPPEGQQPDMGPGQPQAPAPQIAGPSPQPQVDPCQCDPSELAGLGARIVVIEEGSKETIAALKSVTDTLAAQGELLKQATTAIAESQKLTETKIAEAAASANSHAEKQAEAAKSSVLTELEKHVTTETLNTKLTEIQRETLKTAEAKDQSILKSAQEEVRKTVTSGLEHANWFAIGKWAAGMLGLGTVPGLGITFAMLLLGRRAKRRLTDDDTTNEGASGGAPRPFRGRRGSR